MSGALLYPNMSRNPQSNAPNSDPDESDSDIELDLQELDPLTAGGAHERTGAHYYGRAVQGRVDRQIPLRNLRLERSILVERQDFRSDIDDRIAEAEEGLQGPNDENNTSEDSHRSFSVLEDEAPLLKHKIGLSPETSNPVKSRWSVLSSLRLPNFMSGGFDSSTSQPGDSKGIRGEGTSRCIRIGQYPPPRFPPNAVSNAKYTAWGFLPRTLYNEFSFFYNLYFLLVALSQVIDKLKIGFVGTYIYPLAFVLAITLGKEALDDIGRRKRDSETNMEEYTVLRLRGSLRDRPHETKRSRGSRIRTKNAKKISLSSNRTRLDAIEEEEESMGGEQADPISNIKIEEMNIKSRDLKVGDILKLGKDQRIPADLVILKSYTTESAVMASRTHIPDAEVPKLSDSVAEPSQSHITSDYISTKSTNDQQKSSSTLAVDGAGETFIRTDQLDGETDWKLRLASPLTQSLDPRDFNKLSIVAAKPDLKVNEFVGKIEYTPPHIKASTWLDESGGRTQKDNKGPQTAPLNIDNTAWANTVLASNATVLAVVVYTGAQTRQALSTSASRSKTGLLDYEINNLTKILFALTLTLSIVLVALEGFEVRENDAWYVAILKFLILFSTIIPVSLRVNLDMGKSVYAWFIERDQGIPGTVVRTSTIPEELGRIEYLLSDKTGTLTQNGMY